MDEKWQERLKTLGSFFEFIVGPVRMYHFSMTPTAGGDIGRHPGTRGQRWQLNGGGSGEGSLLVQYVARYEHLEKDLTQVCVYAKKIDVTIVCDVKQMKKIKIENENHEMIMKYFSSDRVNLFDIVNDAFSDDFQQMKYPKVQSMEEYKKMYVDGVLDPIVNL